MRYPFSAQEKRRIKDATGSGFISGMVARALSFFEAIKDAVGFYLPRNVTGSTIAKGTVVVFQGVTVGGARAADVSNPLLNGAYDGNTDFGTLYGTIVSDGANKFHVNLYSDSNKTALVGHSASENPDGTTYTEIVEDGDSGLTGKLLLVNSPTAGAFTLLHVGDEGEIVAAPTSSNGPLFVVLDDIAHLHQGYGAQVGLGMVPDYPAGSDDPQEIEVLVKADTDVRFGNILTLSATVAGVADVNGLGVVIGIAKENKIATGSAMRVKAALCGFSTGIPA
jgi:hypothetical protein